MHLLEREVTIAELLKSAGYSTAHIGKSASSACRSNGRDKHHPFRTGTDSTIGS